MSEHELRDISEFAESQGIPSRSRLINMALQQLFKNPTKLNLCRKRKVNLHIDKALFKELNETCKRVGLTRSGIIRLALRDCRKTLIEHEHNAILQ